MVPLLFLIYINDMHNNTEVTMAHYADDFSAYAIVDSFNFMVLLVNLGIDKIDSLLCSNKLYLNAA